MLLKRKRLFAVAFIFSFLTNFFFAEELSEPKKVKLGYFILNQYQEIDENGFKSGASYELLNKIASIANWEYEYVYGDFNELLEKLKAGEIDILNDITYTEERANDFNFSATPEASEESFLCTLPETAHMYSIDYNNFNGKKIGAVKGSSEITLFKNWCKRNNIFCDLVLYNSAEKLVENIHLKKVDAVIMTNIASSFGLEEITKIGSDDVYIAVNKNRPDLLAELNNTINLINKIEPLYTPSLFERYNIYGYKSTKTLSEEELEWIENHPVIKIGCLKSGLPFCEIDKETGKVTGLITSAVQLFKQKLELNDIQITYFFYDSFSELQRALKNNYIDFIFPVYNDFNFQEKDSYVFTNTVASSPLSLVYKKKNSGKEINSIAVISGQPEQAYAISLYSDKKIISYRTVEECIQAVNKGNVDAALFNYYRAIEILKTHKKFTSTNLDELCKLTFGVKKGNKELLTILNRALSLTSSDELNKEFTYYAAKAISYTTVDFFLDYSFIIIFIFISLILISSIAIYNWQRSMQTQKDLEISIANEKEQQRLLDIARKKAEIASNAKTTFLFNMSHDIRTPMNAILGYSEMAKKYSDNKSKVNECLDKLKVSGKHLLTIINDVLDMARIESGKTVPVYQACDLTKLFDNMKTMVFQSMEAKGIHFLNDISQIRNKIVYADEVHINQILLNILNNAIKYTKPGGTINFELKQNSAVLADQSFGSYCFTVEDSGIGMSKEYQEHIFEAFTRENSATVSGIEGTGLGMAIVKHLVDLLEAKINISSEEGKGTKVTIIFNLKLCDEFDYYKSLERKQETTISFKGKRLLLVEDNALNREIARDILEEAGFEVEEADDGTTALEKYKQVEKGYYSFILMDVQMPKMDGYETTINIRTMEDKEKANIPIIAITANAFEEDKKKAFDAGMNAHIAKPIDVDVLKSTLSEIN